MTNNLLKPYNEISKLLMDYIELANQGRNLEDIKKSLAHEKNVTAEGKTQDDTILGNILTFLNERKAQIDSQTKRPLELADTKGEMEIIQNIKSNLEALIDANNKAKGRFGTTRAFNEFKANMTQALDQYNNPDKFIVNDAKKIKSGFFSTLISVIGNYFKKQDAVKLHDSESDLKLLGKRMVSFVEAANQSAKDAESLRDRQQDPITPRKENLAPPLTNNATPPEAKARKAPPAPKFKPLYDAISSGDQAQLSELYNRLGKKLLTQDVVQHIYKTANAKANNPELSEEQRRQFQEGLGHLVTIANSNGITISQAEAGVPQEHNKAPAVAQADQNGRGDLLAAIQAGKVLRTAPAPEASAQAVPADRGSLLAQIQAKNKLFSAPEPGAPPPSYPEGLSDLYNAISSGHKAKVSDAYRDVIEWGDEELLTQENLQTLYDTAKDAQAKCAKISSEHRKFQNGADALVEIAKKENQITISTNNERERER